MHVLRKLTGCLSSINCDNDESLKPEESISLTASTFSQLSSIEDTAIKTTTRSKGNSPLDEPLDIKQAIIIKQK